MERFRVEPADIYTVVNKTVLNNEDRKILTMLYQPIIGPIAISLYLSLWSDLDKIEMVSNEFNHHHLITNMHMSLEEIVSARKSLEAIGLLKTYAKEDNVNYFIYELYSPLMAYEFFNHPILNVVLYNNVGKIEYEKLVKYFKRPRFNFSSFTDITTSFNEKFKSVPYTSYEMINKDIQKRNKLKLNINSNFDMNFLIASIPKYMDPDKIFTKENKELIINLSFIYDIDALKMQNILKTCINERGTINKEELRKTCQNYYEFDNGLLPTVVELTQPEYLRKPIGDNSKRAKLIYTFETISPSDLLRSKNNGDEPVKRDLALVETLIVDYKLKPGVVNVLLDYTLKVNNNKLTKSFVETIAGQWKRLKIETVEEAMALCEKEHKKYRKTNIRQTTTIKEKQEKIPEWFDKNIEKKIADNQSREEIDNLLKEFR